MSNSKNFDSSTHEQYLAEFSQVKEQAQTLADIYNSTPLLPLDGSGEFYRLFTDYEQLIYEKVQAAGNWANISNASQVGNVEELASLCNVLAIVRAEGIKKAGQLQNDPVLAEFSQANPQECRMAEACKFLFAYQAGKVIFKPEFLETLKSCF